MECKCCNPAKMCDK